MLSIFFCAQTKNLSFYLLLSIRHYFMLIYIKKSYVLYFTSSSVIIYLISNLIFLCVCIFGNYFPHSEFCLNSIACRNPCTIISGRITEGFWKYWLISHWEPTWLSPRPSFNCWPQVKMAAVHAGRLGSQFDQFSGSWETSASLSLYLLLLFSPQPFVWGMWTA